MRFFLQVLFQVLIVKPFVFLLCGLKITGRNNLPLEGPAILVANHNSHLDAFLIWTLFPFRAYKLMRPVGAVDYMLSTWLLANFTKIMQMAYITRGVGKQTNLSQPYRALEQGQILIFFPEGSRGEPGVMIPFKSGIGHISSNFPAVPIVPIFIRGTDKIFPRGSLFPWPSNCAVIIGDQILFTTETSEQRARFVEKIVTALEKKSNEHERI